MNQQPLNISRPPDFVFKYRANRVAPAESVITEQTMYQFQRMEYPETGGQLAWFQDVPFPSKGHPFPEAIYAINAAKRLTIMAAKLVAKKDMWPLLFFGLVSKRKKIELLTRFMKAYRETTMIFIAPYVLSERYHTPLCRELRKIFNSFFVSIGVPRDEADGFAEAFLTLVEYDNAYRLRLEDILSETSKEELMNTPKKTIKKLILLLVEREPWARDSDVYNSNVGKFKAFADIFCLFLALPSVKKAFKSAVKDSDFENLQMDEADHYHSLLWSDYNFFGKTINERIEAYKDYHAKHPPFPERITISVPK